MNIKSDSESIPIPKPLPCLNFFEQMDIISKARLCLYLKAAPDEATTEEKNALYEEQRQKILSFVELLHDSLLSEHGKVLLCLYQCE
jgi:hypothetical protein